MNEHINHTRMEKLLLEAARTFNSTLEYEELICHVLRLVIKAVNAEAAMVFRIDHRRSDMKIRFMQHDKPDVRHFNRELGSGLVGWVARYKEPVLLNDASNDQRVDSEIEEETGIKFQSLVTVPLIGKGQMIGVIEAINKDGEKFNETDLDILTGLGDQIAVAIDNAALYRQVKREALEKKLLYEIGIELSGTLQLDDVLSKIMSSLKQVVDFDAGGVFIIDPEHKQIGSVFTLSYEPEREEDLNLKIGQGLIGHVVEKGEPIIVSDVENDERYISAREATRSEIVVPMKLDGRVIGVLNLESDEHDAYEESDLALMLTFASQAAISVERARLHEEILSGKKIEEQLNVAREIQQSFLPPSNPTITGYDVSGMNIPSGQVGGDYYDFIDIVEGQTGVAIGDVSGKGIPAALIMASFRASLIAEIRNNYAIRAIAQKVNNLLFESIKSGNFVTAVYSVLDSKNHILTFCNCGHDRPILIRANGEVEYLIEGGPILGVTTNAVYEERPIFLMKGDTVVFYTDGVTEVFDENGKQFGAERLIEQVKTQRDKSAIEISDHVYKEVTKFAGSEHVYDDFTMMIIKRK